MSLIVKYLDGVRFEAVSLGHRIVIDQPKTEDGTDQGMTPVELFNASLASCVAYYAVTFLKRRMPNLTELEVQSSWQYSENPHRISAMHLKIVTPRLLTETEKRGLFRTVEHCTIENTLKHNPSIRIEIEAGEETT